MADNLVKVKMKSGQIKEISARIAYDKNYQASHGFKVLDGSISVTEAPEPQKKIEEKSEQKKVAVETSEPKGEVVNDELGAGVETVNLNEEDVTATKTKTTAKAETVEEKVKRLHKAGKSAQEIKTETGINMNTIKSIINKIK